LRADAPAIGNGAVFGWRREVARRPQEFGMSRAIREEYLPILPDFALLRTIFFADLAGNSSYPSRSTVVRVRENANAAPS
jgi:hypothetical protein